MPDLDDDEMTLLLDADFPRVDLVGRPANGVPRFLVAKQAEDASGLLDPEFVRELIGKQAAPEPAEEVVTMTGSPAAIAAMIHKAAQRQAGPGDVAKAELSSAELNDLPDSAFAYVEPGGKKDADGKTTPRSLRHFAIHDKAHADNAAARIAQGAKFGDKAKAKVEAAQRKFGEKVSKDAMGPDLDDGVDGMDPTVPLAEPDEMGPGDPAVPGSPAWESIDAATACKWTSILARARVAVDLLAEREMLEAASANPDDAENAWDLQDVCSAIDYAISVLAPFAVAEQSEADCGEADMMAMAVKGAGTGPGRGLHDARADLTAIRKALGDGGQAVTALTAIETFGAIVRKSGRVLSSVNEAHIREAAQRLNTVLSSLPSAPATDDGQPVAKQEGTTVAETQTKDAAPVTKAAADEQARDTGTVNAGGTAGLGEPGGTGPAGALPADGPQQALPGDAPGRQVIKAAVGVFGPGRRFLGLADSAAILTDIAKAEDGKKAMCVVYNQAGKLMGIVDPDDITPVANSEAEPDEAPGSSDGDDTAPAADGDMTPAPAAGVGTPADAVQPDGTVTKSSNDKDVFAVLESIVAKAVAAALDGRTPAEDIAKQADVAGLLQEVKTLKARLATVEEHPAAPGVFTHGATPPPGSVPPARPSLRGQDQGTQPVNVAKAAELKRQISSGIATAPEQNQAWNELMNMSLAKFAEIRGEG